MVELIRRLLVAGIALGAIAGNADEIKRFFDDTVQLAETVTTVGDLRSISIMLDREFILRGSYPREDRFERWLEAHFKENNLKPLNVDQWGNPFVYETAGNRKAYTLLSAGPDGLQGTDDDMIITGP
jgi:general secretion pathway protein G